MCRLSCKRWEIIYEDFVNIFCFTSTVGTVCTSVCMYIVRTCTTFKLPSLPLNSIHILSLSSILFSHPFRIYTADFKMDVYLRIAKLYLEEGDHVSAEAYINRAGMLQSDVDRSDLHVIYKVRTCSQLCVVEHKITVYTYVRTYMYVHNNSMHVRTIYVPV